MGVCFSSFLNIIAAYDSEDLDKILAIAHAHQTAFKTLLHENRVHPLRFSTIEEVECEFDYFRLYHTDDLSGPEWDTLWTYKAEKWVTFQQAGDGIR